MKLRFKVSQSTDLDPATIKGLIALKLKAEEYRIQELEDKSATFDDNPWIPRWNFQAARRFSGGKFEITRTNDGGLVTLNYYISLIAPAITLIILSIVCIIHAQYYAPLFFLAFYIIAIFFNSIQLKGVAKEMLDEILNQSK